IYEKAEITSLSARMRVHVNGLLPLITKSVVEYPNGDEVAITLVYERLDKHCTKCLRLDHELKECLVARAEAKEKASQESNEGRSNLKLAQDSGSVRGGPLAPVQDKPNRRETDYRSQSAFQFEAKNSGKAYDRRVGGESKGSQQHRVHKPQNTPWQERSLSRRSYQHRERPRYEVERSSRPPRVYDHQRRLPPPLEKTYYYREVQREAIEAKDMGSSASKSNHELRERGTPLLQEDGIQSIPSEALNIARDEVRDVMLQYSKCSDPSEREARKERMRQAEERGQLEEAAVQLARNGRRNEEEETPTHATDKPDRQSVSQRLGPNSSERIITTSKSKAGDRIPAPLRLGEQTSPASQTRIPISQRLGPLDTDETNVPVGEVTENKRKPGRPPGKRRVLASPSAGAKRRKAQTAKIPKCRKQLNIEEARLESRVGSSKPTEKQRSKPAAAGVSGDHSHSSDNIPLNKMIPKSSRRK
ncbi:unnamed protein product, partial [Brassica rapa subsp. narinosa]